MAIVKDFLAIAGVVAALFGFLLWVISALLRMNRVE